MIELFIYKVILTSGLPHCMYVCIYVFQLTVIDHPFNSNIKKLRVKGLKAISRLFFPRSFFPSTTVYVLYIIIQTSLNLKS